MPGKETEEIRPVKNQEDMFARGKLEPVYRKSDKEASGPGDPFSTSLLSEKLIGQR